MNSSADEDIALIRQELTTISSEAQRLPWAAERPWKERTHVWMDRGLPIVDLHDLNTRLAKKTIKKVLRKGSNVQAGAICFITGIGSKAVGGGSIREMALSVIANIAKDKGWGLQPNGPGRVVCIMDPEKAPAAATGKLEKIWYVCFAGFAVLLIFFLLRSCWPA